MKCYVAVTDNDWFRFLRQRDHLDEVNFWQPGGTRQFRTLNVGQPFLFKLHAPENFVAGGGFFMHSSLCPASLAWQAFGEKNGAASEEEMRRRIEKYRRIEPRRGEDYVIGCIILGDPFFFDDKDWLDQPEDFSPNIVQGKTYDLMVSPGRELWEEVQLRRRGGQLPRVAEPASQMYGPPTTLRPRLGQGTFRLLVTDIYGRRCAVTGEKALPALHAAHIRPVKEGGEHRLDNGLLLRSDVHTLFDRGYVTVTPNHKFRTSGRLKVDFDDGESYRGLAGGRIWLPARQSAWPNGEFLEWHNDTVFLG